MSPLATQMKPHTILNLHYRNRKNQTKYCIWKHSDANKTDGYLTDCQ